MGNKQLKVFLVTRKADWCEDDAIVVFAIYFMIQVFGGGKGNKHF